MRLSLYVLWGLIILLACNKDKLETKPSLKLKSISSSVVPKNGNLTFVFEYADKEGDVSDSIFLRKIRTNLLPTKTVRDSFALTMPSFPDRKRGTIELQLKYQEHLVSAENPGSAPNIRNDTLIFKFSLRDKAKHISDTITTTPIVILR